MEGATVTISSLRRISATKAKQLSSQDRADAKLAARLRDKLLSRLDPQLDISNRRLVEDTIRSLFPKVVAEEHAAISGAERQRLQDLVTAEILGYGPIEALLRDDSVTEVMVNGPKQVYIERRGKIEKTSLCFEDDQHLLRIIERIIVPLGRRADEASPMVDARLPDGSRVNVTIPPISLIGPVLTIRKFARIPYTDQDLKQMGTVTPDFIEFARACVIARLNMLISGGTSTGKTTLLNMFSGYIPANERIVTIEDAAELQLKQEHVVTLESRPPNIEGRGQVTIRDLVINALRMRPDRILVGEVRGGEALDMLQAMNTGHDGSLTTLHCNSARDGLNRLETMVLMSGMDLPLRAIREQIASALDIVIHLERMNDGSRRVVQVAEVQGMEGDVIMMQDIFHFVQTGIRDGEVLGQLRPTGIRPNFYDKIKLAGVQLPAHLFGTTLDISEYRS
jgi:pilus assembly protein CpaF